MVSPANPGYGVEELQHQLKNSGATVVVTQAPFLPVVLRAATNVGIAHGRVIVLPSAKSAYVSSLASSLPSARHNDNVLRLLWQKRKATPAKRLYVLARMLPSWSTHRARLTILLHYSFYKCAKVAVMPRYTLPLFCKTVEAHRVSRVYLVPPVALELAQTTLSSETGTDLSSIKFMTSAGAPLSPVIVHALHARHGIKLVEGYGLSETSPGAFMMCIEDYPAAIGTVGKLLPNQKAKLLDVDDSKRDINTDSGQSGEICIKGPNVFKGGWLLRTGDIGVFVKAPRVGICLRITDRIKELIKYKGFQVAPAELEGILLRHEGVADVCVVGVQSPQALATEVPRAYVVKTPGWGEGEVERVVAADEIRRWSDKKLANHKRLRGGVVFVDSLPRTPSGKLLRRVLRSTNFDGKAKL
ncbi:phenylacetyl-CoA ligase [Apiospora saccharicola]